MTETPKKKRGLASASQEARDRVARAGGNARHASRGNQTADLKRRKGGLAPGRQRRPERKSKKVDGK